MKFVFTCIILVLTQLVFSQLNFEKTEIDFGNIGNQDQRFLDIEVKNIGTKKEYFLSIKKPKDLVVLTKGEFVLADSTNFMRVQVNPTQKGKFSFEFEMFTSDKNEATKFKVKGNFTETPENISANFQACPNFSAKPVQRQLSNKFTIRTIDYYTKKDVDATVFIIQNGTDISQINTKNGFWKDKLPLGFTYFYVKKEAYKVLDTSAYINANRNEITLELKMDPSYCLPVPKENQQKPIEIKEEKVVVIEEVKPDEKQMRKDLTQILQTEKPTQADTIKRSSIDDFPLEYFDTTYFKAINVVFLLDVSSSMVSYDKFDLLKFSLTQLLEILRPQDQIALVTYADDANVILPSSKGNEKEKILAEIKKLKASGKTAGLKGIKKAFQVAEKNLIPNGTNMVIVLTDGAFNKNNGDYFSVIDKYTSKGILFSVVGIKNFPKDELNMHEAASRGNGAYVPVFKLADAQQNVIREIKRVTFKK
jgi:Ca-activated chloride channel family protein